MSTYLPCSGASCPQCTPARGFSVLAKLCATPAHLESAPTRSRSVECTRLLLKNSKPPMPLFTNAPLGPRGCGCLCASRPEGLHERPRSGDASLLQVLLQSRAPTPSRLAWARPRPCSPPSMAQDQSPGPLLPAAQLHAYERYCHRYEHYDTEAPSASRLGSMSAEIVPASIDIPPRNRGTTLTAPH